MMQMFKRLLRCTRATAAVETAIFAPIYLMLTLGVTDLGMGIFVRMSVNAASQTGAIYAVANAHVKNHVCEVTTTTTPAAWINASACVAAIKAVMNDATGDSAFCTGSVCGTPSVRACAPPDVASTTCVTVTASYPYVPLLPDATYSWAQSMTVISTSTVRIL